MRLDTLKELIVAQRRVLAVALCVVGALAVHHWLVSPHLASLHAAQRYERATGTIMDKGKVVGAQLRIKRLELQRLQAEQTALVEGIFHPAEVEVFFGELEHMCTEAQCAVLSCGYVEKGSSIRRRVSDVNAPTLQKTIRLILRADYDSLVQLVEKLQTYPRKVWIDAMKLSASTGTSGITCNLEISIYIFHNEENESDE
jgi:hypothetical protein